MNFNCKSRKQRQIQSIRCLCVLQLKSMVVGEEFHRQKA